MDEKMIQSYVYRDDQAWFVSTAKRSYDIHGVMIRGEETMIWEWDQKKRDRGKIVYQGEEGLGGHLLICKSLRERGVVREED